LHNLLCFEAMHRFSTDFNREIYQKLDQMIDINFKGYV